MDETWRAGRMAVETTKPQLTARDLGRYQRQMVLPQVGIEGQQKLLSSRVLVVGAGALGSAAAMYLVTAGVGTVGLVDGDTVELSNLHRQILHDERHVGRLKTESGARRLEEMNADVHIHQHPEYLSSDNVLRLFADYDVIINGSDNFPTRYLVNDGAVLLRKPLIDAAILRFEGQLAVFMPGHGCYRCLFPSPPPPGVVPDCAEAGIFGAMAGVLGSLQAVEALKVLLHLGRASHSRFLVYDALGGTWQPVSFHRDPDCVVCGDHPSLTAPIDYEHFCGMASSTGSAEGISRVLQEFAVTPEDCTHLMEDSRLIILDVRERDEFLIGHMQHAVHCPLEEMDQFLSQAGNLRDAPLLVVCEAGVKSAYAAEYLRSRGYEARTLLGGMRAWRYVTQSADD